MHPSVTPAHLPGSMLNLVSFYPPTQFKRRTTKMELHHIYQQLASDATVFFSELIEVLRRATKYVTTFCISDIVLSVVLIIHSVSINSYVKCIRDLVYQPVHVRRHDQGTHRKI